MGSLLAQFAVFALLIGASTAGGIIGWTITGQWWGASLSTALTWTVLGLMLGASKGDE